jgi:DNA-binding HxlR family transcriptional regulator
MEVPEAQPQRPEPRAPLREALDAVGDRWKLLIVAALLDGPRRFGDLERELDGIAPNVLTARLRALEETGLVVGRPYSERPPRYTYELTDAGRGLANPIRLLAHWGASREGGQLPLHDECGTPLEAGWFCPTCERLVRDDEAEELDYA